MPEFDDLEIARCFVLGSSVLRVALASDHLREIGCVLMRRS